MALSLFDRIADLFARTAPFDTLSEEDRAALLQKMTLEMYAPGEVILQQGEDVHRALYVVEDGLVRLADAATGRTMDMVGPGSPFGSYGLVQGGALPYEATAVEQTSCALVAADTFTALLKRNEAFRAHFDEDIKRYVRSLDESVDASGAFLLFDTAIGKMLRAEAPTVEATATVREAATEMAASESDAVVVVQDGVPIGVVTEGDLVERIVATGGDTATPVMQLVQRPPIALRSDERLFDAMQTMMRHRIRRLVVTDGETGALVGLLTSDDVSHFRGLDPVATTERLERAHSVGELAALRADANRRLYRLYNQGVHSEDLLDVVTEVDDQLKQRVLCLVEAEVREEAGADAPPEGGWAWLVFGPAGRRESALKAWQDNGIVYTMPPDGRDPSAFYARLGERAVAALRECGYEEPEAGVTAAHEAFRQPVGAWGGAYDAWTAATDAEATGRAAILFDLRSLYGADDAAEHLRTHVAERLASDAGRLPAVLARDAVRIPLPLTTFGRFEVDDMDGVAGFDIRERGLQPVVRMARAMALDVGYVESAGTLDRLRYVAGTDHPLADHSRALVPAFKTLADLHLRTQMQAAENGAAPSDRIDPDALHRSQQNLLKETFKAVGKAQDATRKHYKL